MVVWRLQSSEPAQCYLPGSWLNRKVIPVNNSLSARVCERCKQGFTCAAKSKARYCSKICSRQVDLLGHTFGRLTVIGRGPIHNGWKTTWLVSCVCGNKKIVRTHILKSGDTKSCGCLSFKHGQCGRRGGKTKSPAYSSWQSMLKRCDNPKEKQYADYGGRGIRVCAAWYDFRAFYADMGDRPAGTTLDRYPDVNGNYEPGNCRWATRSQQRRNVRNWLTSRWVTTAEIVAPGLQSGSLNRGALLSEDAVRDIRQRYAAGAAICDLAIEFNVSESGMSSVVHRRSWRHVA